MHLFAVCIAGIALAMRWIAAASDVRSIWMLAHTSSGPSRSPTIDFQV